MARKKITERMRDLEQQAKRFSPRAPSLRSCPKHPALEVGQVWVTKADWAVPGIANRWQDEEPVLVILLDFKKNSLAGKTVCVALPVLTDIGMAGPQDAYLPAALLGHPAIVCVGSALEILEDNLKYCIGIIPDPWPSLISDFQACIAKGLPAPKGVTVGLSYLSEFDLRAVFHKEELPRRLDDLRAPVLELRRKASEADASALAAAAKKLRELKATLSALLSELDQMLAWRNKKQESSQPGRVELPAFVMAHFTRVGPESKQSRQQAIREAEATLRRKIQLTERMIFEEESRIRGLKRYG